MSADILQFLPRANPKADRAYWIKEAEREAAMIAGAVEIEGVRVVERPCDVAPFEGPETDSA